MAHGLDTHFIGTMNTAHRLDSCFTVNLTVLMGTQTPQKKPGAKNYTKPHHILIPTQLDQHNLRILNQRLKIICELDRIAAIHHPVIERQGHIHH